MIKLYVLPSHPTCRFAQNWFETNKVSYQLRKVTDDDPLTVEEIMDMIYSAVDMNVLISRTDVAKQKKIRNMCIKSEFIPFVQKNPKVFKFPIIQRNRDITTGYNEEEYDRFLPREVRKRRFAELLKAASE